MANHDLHDLHYQHLAREAQYLDIEDSRLRALGPRQPARETLDGITRDSLVGERKDWRVLTINTLQRDLFHDAVEVVGVYRYHWQARLRCWWANGGSSWFRIYWVEPHPEQNTCA